jgi:hypothetical protein
MAANWSWLVGNTCSDRTFCNLNKQIKGKENLSFICMILLPPASRIRVIYEDEHDYVSLSLTMLN